MTENNSEAIRQYAIRSPAGPPFAKLPPVPKNNPVPLWHIVRICAMYSSLRRYLR